MFSALRSIRLLKKSSFMPGSFSVVLWGRPHCPSALTMNALHLPRPAAWLMPSTTRSISSSNSRVDPIEAAMLERMRASRLSRFSRWLMNAVASAITMSSTALTSVSPMTVLVGTPATPSLDTMVIP
jgi:hypothetical protein